MERKDEQELIEFIEATASDPEAWRADDPAPEDRSRRLEAQISIRLDSDLAELLRKVASRAGVGYTSMLRRWIEERLAEEVRSQSSLPELVVIPQLQQAGEGRADESRFTAAHGRAVATTA